MPCPFCAIMCHLSAKMPFIFPNFQKSWKHKGYSGNMRGMLFTRFLCQFQRSSRCILRIRLLLTVIWPTFLRFNLAVRICHIWYWVYEKMDFLTCTYTCFGFKWICFARCNQKNLSRKSDFRCKGLILRNRIGANLQFYWSSLRNPMEPALQIW